MKGFSATYRTTFVASVLCGMQDDACSGTKLVSVDVAIKGWPCCFASRGAILRRPSRSRFGSSQLLGPAFAMLHVEALKCMYSLQKIHHFPVCEARDCEAFSPSLTWSICSAPICGFSIRSTLEVYKFTGVLSDVLPVFITRVKKEAVSHLQLAAVVKLAYYDSIGQIGRGFFFFFFFFQTAQ